MQYIDITMSTVFSGIVGLVSPFLFPFLFKVLGKWVKRDLTGKEKRLVITTVAFLISIGLVAYYFEWSGEFFDRVCAFAMYLVLNFVTIKGVIQSIYEGIIKNIPEIDKKLEEVERYK